MAGTPGLKKSAVKKYHSDSSGVVEQLFAKPEEFSFVQAVRILYHAYGKDKRILDFIRESVRIRPHLSLGFPATDIVSLEKLQPQKAGTPLFRLTVSMLGLYGASSPLPTFYTEELLEEVREDRTALRDFYDCINDGFYAQYLHAGWFRYRPLHAVTEQKNLDLLGHFYAPAGMTDPALASHDQESFNILPLISGLSHFPRSATGLESFLAGTVGVPVRVEQCIERRAPIPEYQQCCLGRRHLLGESAILGSQALDRNGKIAVYLGPCSREELIPFAPGQKKHQFLRRMVEFYFTEPLAFDLHFVLQKKKRKELSSANASSTLGQTGYGQLGCDSWLALPENEQGAAFFPHRG